MCNDQKMLKQQLKNSKKAKYEMDNFCEQFGLTPIAPSWKKGKKKHDKIYRDYKHKKKKKKKKNKDALNLMISMPKRKMFLEKKINRNLVKENALIVENMVTIVKSASKNLVN